MSVVSSRSDESDVKVIDIDTSFCVSIKILIIKRFEPLSFDKSKRNKKRFAFIRIFHARSNIKYKIEYSVEYYGLIILTTVIVRFFFFLRLQSRCRRVFILTRIGEYPNLFTIKFLKNDLKIRSRELNSEIAQTKFGQTQTRLLGKTIDLHKHEIERLHRFSLFRNVKLNHKHEE